MKRKKTFKKRRPNFNSKYHISKRKLSPKQFFHKRIIKRFLKLLLIIIFAIIFFGTLIFIFFTPFFHIKPWKIEVIRKNIYIDAEEIETFIKDSFEKGLFEKNIFLLNTDDISNAIKSKFEEIEKATVKKIPPESLKIYIEDRDARLLFVSSSGKKYIVDSDGVVVRDREEKDLIEVYTDYVSVEPKFRDRLFEPEEVKEIYDVSRKFQQEFGIRILKVGFLRINSEIYLHTEKHFVVKLERNKIDEGFKKLKTALKEINLEKENIEYIDLRIESKVFYMNR